MKKKPNFVKKIIHEKNDYDVFKEHRQHQMK